jgi:hypothetical protein
MANGKNLRATPPRVSIYHLPLTIYPLFARFTIYPLFLL